MTKKQKSQVQIAKMMVLVKLGEIVNFVSETCPDGKNVCGGWWKINVTISDNEQENPNPQNPCMLDNSDHLKAANVIGGSRNVQKSTVDTILTHPKCLEVDRLPFQMLG